MKPEEAKKSNILFTSVGRRVSVLQFFKKAIKDLGIDGKIIAADSSENSAARYVADLHFTVPRVTDNKYLQTLADICTKCSVDILIPLIDTELLLLARNKKFFTDRGVTVLVSSPETVEISRNKRRTSEFFGENGFNSPGVFSLETILGLPNPRYPYFVKPADGSSSINAFKVNDEKELKFFAGYVPNAMIQEFICGSEYTLDILADFDGKVRCVVPRLRLETRAGEISKGITEKNYHLIESGKQLVESLPQVLGCITVQCFLHASGRIDFIEINPRFGGGFPLSYAAGANFPLWILRMYLGDDPDVKIDGWKDGLKMLRYDDAIYL